MCSTLTPQFYANINNTHRKQTSITSATSLAFVPTENTTLFQSTTHCVQQCLSDDLLMKYIGISFLKKVRQHLVYPPNYLPTDPTTFISGAMSSTYPTQYYASSFFRCMYVWLCLFPTQRKTDVKHFLREYELFYRQCCHGWSTQNKKTLQGPSIDLMDRLTLDLTNLRHR